MPAYLLRRILEEEAFENEGDNSALASEIMRYALAKDTQIKELAAKATKDAFLRFRQPTR